MKITFNAKNTRIPEAKLKLIESKLQKLDRYLRDDTEVSLRLTTDKKGDVAEITVWAGNTVIRSEEVSKENNMLTAAEKAIDKLERQIIRNKTKLRDKKRGSVIKDTELAEEEPTPLDAAPEEEPVLVRRKSFPLKPMGVDEAAMQMELVEHDFYMFLNAETGLVSVLYKRADGDLGLLEPEK